MKVQNLIEFLDAAHLTDFIHSPFEERGGIGLVAPPGAMKTAIIRAALQDYPNALVCTDLNVNTLVKLRNDLTAGNLPTLAFTSYEKLYARHSSTSSNIETSIMALAEEGFTRASFEDQRMTTIPARALIVAAMVPSFHAVHFTSWQESGFLRRFIWIKWRLADPYKIMQAIIEWQKLPLNSIRKKTPTSRDVPYDVQSNEAQHLRRIMGKQEVKAGTTPQILMQKIFAVLKWKYKKNDEEKPMEIINDIAPALAIEAKLEI